MKSCFFIGHRDAPEEVFQALAAAVERHITQLGVSEFIVGGYGAFDRMAARAVLNAKATYPQVTLWLLLPYHPAERPVDTPPGFDGTFYPPGMEKVPRALAIPRANRYMVDHSDCLIAYVRHSASNARNLLDYTQKHEQRGAIHVTAL